VIHRARHLREERLFECYLAERSNQVDPPAAEHLADCPSCAARYADLATFMETLRNEAETDADALFTSDRLRAQRQQIARRIEQIGRAARVLSFPSPVMRAGMTASARTSSRWIAAAVAAGLFIGVAVSASYQLGVHHRETGRLLPRQAGSAPWITPVATRGSGQAQIASDDAVMSDLELALERPRTRELIAFDAFTPHVREIRDR
jgi:anti-sigma factor RsiW